MKAKTSRRILTELKKSWAIAKKDMKITYLRPGTIMFGIMFPVFMFFSFAIGRNLSPSILIPGLMSITMFFSSSSTGAMVVPIERKIKTYERMLAAPISPLSILFGETLGGFIYGMFLALIPLAIGIFLYDINIESFFALMVGIGFGSFGFSAMGIMFAAMPTETPGDVMLVLNFVRLPLIFVSGVFIPIEKMGIYRIIASLSPLTYVNELLKLATGGKVSYGLMWDILGILIFTLLFFGIGIKLHERNRKNM
jgi:ABC-2 type transport system permease protein